MTSGRGLNLIAGAQCHTTSVGREESSIKKYYRDPEVIQIGTKNHPSSLQGVVIRNPHW